MPVNDSTEGHPILPAVSEVLHYHLLIPLSGALHPLLQLAQALDLHEINIEHHNSCCAHVLYILCMQYLKVENEIPYNCKCEFGIAISNIRNLNSNYRYPDL